MLPNPRPSPPSSLLQPELHKPKKPMPPKTLTISASDPLFPTMDEPYVPRPPLRLQDLPKIRKKRAPCSVYSAAGSLWHEGGNSALREAWDVDGVNPPKLWAAKPVIPPATANPGLPSLDLPPEPPFQQQKLESAQVNVKQLTKMDQEINGALQGMRAEMDTLTKKLTEAKRSQSVPSLPPIGSGAATSTGLEGSMAGNSLASMFLEPSAADMKEDAHIKRMQKSRQNAKPQASQAQKEVAATEQALRALRARERDAMRALQSVQQQKQAWETKAEALAQELA